MLLDLHGSQSRGFHLFWRLPCQQLPLADERHHAGGHSKRGRVGCGEPLQANDQVVAPFDDDLPRILFSGTEEKSKGLG